MCGRESMWAAPAGRWADLASVTCAPGCRRLFPGLPTELSRGISEALFNTALGIGTSALSLIMYNVFTTTIDAITDGIDESGFTLTQSFASLYK